MIRPSDIHSPFKYEKTIPSNASMLPVLQQVRIVRELAEKYEIPGIEVDSQDHWIKLVYTNQKENDVDYLVHLANVQKDELIRSAIYNLVCLCEALSSTPTITLVNGRILECSPISSIKPKCNCDKDDLWNLFADNVNLFLQNADRILGDSRLFLTPVSRKKNCFCSSIATLGEFIEFWIYCKENGIESNGYPICDICGNPMTGSHGCRAVTHNGERVKATLNISFH